MISLGSNEEQSSELMELIKKFPTSAYVAERLHRVGWGSELRTISSKSFQGGASPGMWEGAIRGTRTFPSVQTTLPMMKGQMSLRYRVLNGWVATLKEWSDTPGRCCCHHQSPCC
jgi:hypothetical protein